MTTMYHTLQSTGELSLTDGLEACDASSLQNNNEQNTNGYNNNWDTWFERKQLLPLPNTGLI